MEPTCCPACGEYEAQVETLYPDGKRETQCYLCGCLRDNRGNVKQTALPPGVSVQHFPKSSVVHVALGRGRR